LPLIPIPDEPEEEAAEADMELDLEECYELLCDIDAPDEEEE
jgi:hypothetical protein